MKRFKSLFIFIAILISIQTSAQFCTEDERFSEVNFFSNDEINLSMDVVYGNAITWDGVAEDLKMDFYYPSFTADPMESRPFILLIHGGGFIEGDKSSYNFECRELAKRGYVVATMNYRLGFDQSDISNIVNAVYRAQQDANAALRFTKEHSSSLKINTSFMFIGGGSAGSITSLFTAYMDQSEWNSSFPGIESSLGSIDSSGNDLPHSFVINGILNQWGAGPNSAITPGELIPMISFHGALDEIVPIGEGGFGTIGSQILHDRLIDNEVCSDFTLDPQGDHVVYETIEGREFMINRTSCFFKSIFCDSCTSFFSTEIVAANCSGILSSNDFSENSKTTIYPNPFKNQLNFTNLTGNEYFLLYNINGSVIYSGKNIQFENFQQLAKGMYLLEMQTEGKKEIFKLFKD